MPHQPQDAAIRVRGALIAARVAHTGSRARVDLWDFLDVDLECDGTRIQNMVQMCENPALRQRMKNDIFKLCQLTMLGLGMSCPPGRCMF